MIFLGGFAVSRFHSLQKLNTRGRFEQTKKPASEETGLSEPRPGIDPGTSILPRWRSTTELSGQQVKLYMALGAPASANSMAYTTILSSGIHSSMLPAMPPQSNARDKQKAGGETDNSSPTGLDALGPPRATRRSGHAARDTASGLQRPLSSACRDRRGSRRDGYRHDGYYGRRSRGYRTRGRRGHRGEHRGRHDA